MSQNKASDANDQQCHDASVSSRLDGYLPIENYGIVGNMRTVALCGTDGSLDFCCYPEVDSPSIFCRLLDKDKGGHFSIQPTVRTNTKQQYLLNTNVLVTRFLHEDGVCHVTDYMPRPSGKTPHELLPWVMRQLKVIRGKMTVLVVCSPAFNYARDSHTTKIVQNENIVQYPNDTDNPRHPRSHVGEEKILFSSANQTLDLRWVARSNENGQLPDISWQIVEPGKSATTKEATCDNTVSPDALGPAAIAEISLSDGQQVTFILREPLSSGTVQTDCSIEERLHHRTTTQATGLDPPLSSVLVGRLFQETVDFWLGWIAQSSYRGRWREMVERSALLLKLLVYEPTGAVVAAPTFSLPEDIGGGRNWDYRFTWVRDASFTIYALIRLGLTTEAEAYMKFMEKRFEDSNPDGSLQIMYGIRGEKELTEETLPHLDGYRGSRPVRIGNGAYDHLQLDIYGELLDAAYLYNKFGPPISYDMWCHLRRLVNYVCDHWHEVDMSIWEVRSQKQNFLYSKVMCWVAVDRGLRLSEKRVFPCPDRERWLATRDTIYEEIQEKGYNKEIQSFTQSYESRDVVDAAVLIMPLVFFISPTDPRLLNTIDRIMKPLEKGGLTANSLVYRYNHITSDDGVGGGEGTFTMCTLWLIEALTRAGKYRKDLLMKAYVMFQQMIGYANHVQLYSEELAPGGELLGNFPQAFTHIAFISAAFNLNRVDEH